MANLIKFSFKYCIILALIVVIQGERIRSSFGEYCNSTNRCDSRKSLTCKNEVCECLMLDTMTFDISKEICVVLAGEKCTFRTVEVQEEDDKEKIWKEELPCVPNANCLTSGFCGCQDNFMESKKGTCEPKGTYGNDCKSSSDCRQDLHFACQRDKCSCNSSYAMYDVPRGKCIAKVGEICNELLECPQNSECDSLADQNTRKCVCNEDYYASSDGYCKKKRGYGESCDNPEGCVNDYNLVCDNNDLCKCDPAKSYYDLEAGECVVFAGGFCVDSYNREHQLGPKKCIEGSTCTAEDTDYDPLKKLNYNRQICKCSSNHFASANGTCESKRGYNEVCQSNDECLNGGQFPLECKSGLCKCREDEVIFDPKKKSCAKSVRGSCSNIDSTECVYMAHCENEYYRKRQRNGYHYYPYQHENGRGICTCSSNHSPTTTGLCQADYDVACGSGDSQICHVERGYACLNKKCRCEYEEDQYLDSSSRNCITLVRGPCGGNISSSCVTNSECVDIGEDIRECRCKSGYVPVDRKCELAYGQQCNAQNILCDREALLSCVNGICKCKAFQFYDENELRCRGLVGSICDLAKDNFCADGATCKAFRNVEGLATGMCQCGEGHTMKSDRSCAPPKQKGTSLQKNDTKINSEDELMAKDESIIQNTL